METLSIILLTYNSERTISKVAEQLLRISDDIVAVDSGSSDSTLTILEKKGIKSYFHKYETHALQMNFAIGLAKNDWVLCVDSDELFDNSTVENINRLKLHLEDPLTAYRISRYWYVLGKIVHAIYPVSSPDYPVRLFNRTKVQFNDSPVDDKPFGFIRTEVINGHVKHDTFFSIHEIFQKLNEYTSRLVKYKKITPSLWRAFSHALVATWLWYFRKGGFKDGRIGIVTTVYAGLYTFMKYFKAWYLAKD